MPTPAYEAAMDALGAVVTDEYQPSIHVMRLPLPSGSTEESLWAGVAKTHAAARSGPPRRRAPRCATTTTGELLEAFGELLVERADALGIAMRPELGYLAAWQRLLAAGQARLLVAEHEGQLAGGSARLPPGRHAFHGVLRRPGRPAPRAAGHDAPGALDGHPRGARGGRHGHRAGRRRPARTPGAARSR